MLWACILGDADWSTASHAPGWESHTTVRYAARAPSQRCYNFTRGLAEHVLEAQRFQLGAVRMGYTAGQDR